MRADRLLSILMLLQKHGMMTAHALAQALEVSQRTIYRDMDSLSSARFPVYADKGKGGGYALLPDYDLNLTGFNSRDIQALASLNIPGSMDEIGLGSSLRTALQKLLSAIDADPENDPAWMQSRFYMHSPARFFPHGRHTNLPVIQKAVWEDRLITCRLRYPIHFGLSDPLTMAPFTLVTSDKRWYVIAARKTFTRVYPLENLIDVQLLHHCFERPDNYDPKNIWNQWQKVEAQLRNNFEVLVRITDEMMPWLPLLASNPFVSVKNQEREQAGWNLVRIYFDNLHQARTQILGFGSAIEVIQPESLRNSVIDYANNIKKLYE